MRFTIRDLLWLTVAVALTFGWWRWMRHHPRHEGIVFGNITVGGGPGPVRGKPLKSGRALVHLSDGRFLGVPVQEGQFTIHHVPLGKHRVTLEGDGVPTKLSGEDSWLTAEIDNHHMAAIIDLEIRP